MPFTFKLSQRLARLKSAVVLAAGATLVACQRPARVTDTNGTTITQVVVWPQNTALHPSATQQFVAFGRTAVGDSLPVAVQWSASGGSITPGGLYTAAQTPGSYNVVALQVGGLLADTAAVTVIRVPVASVAVSPSTSSVLLGGTVQLTATPQDSAGSPLTDRVVTWSTSASAVATVDANGSVTGVGGGTATITATSETKSGTATITVSSVPVASVTVTPTSASVFVGGTVQLTATPKDSAGSPLTGRTVSWASRATGVARVSTNGRVTGVTAGTATITATSEGKSDSASVTVNIVPVATVSVTPATASVGVNGTVQLTATPKDSAGGALTSRPVTWQSSPTSVATVSSTGMVTGVAAGTATITATSEGKNGSATITVTSFTGTHAGYYASPGGTSAGTGSSGSPWDLRTALAGGKGLVQPGDTIWMRGGTYSGSFTSSLQGSAAAPIVVRQYPGERAVIDGVTAADGIPMLIVDGAWTVFWGFEVMNSRPERFSTNLNIRQPGVYVRNASNVKLINLVVHDVGQGVFLEPGTHNIELYGWIIYNGGNENGVRSAGHAIYIKNDGVTQKLVRDNVMFNNFGFGIHSYADAGTGPLKNIRFTGNVAFNNGTLSIYPQRNFHVGGDDVADQIVADSNMMYNPPVVTSGNVRIGYSSTLNGTMTFRDNYAVGGTPVIEMGYWQALTVSNNTLLGGSRMVQLNDGNTAGQQWSGNTHYRTPTAAAWQYSGTDRAFGAWQSATGLGVADQATGSMPTVTKVFVRRNVYEPGRAFVVVYNWGGLGSVAADLSGVLQPGDRYEVRSVQALFGAPLASGTFGGGSITLPLGAVTPAAPIGGSPRAPLVTGPVFDVFLITRTN